jgi:aminopeptidase Y
MARSFITLAGALALSSGAAAAVLPSAPEGQTPFSMSSKPLVSTEALQASINRGNLMKRAAHLYGIANRSTEAWGHPTRIIGSKGASFAHVRISP